MASDFIAALSAARRMASGSPAMSQLGAEHALLLELEGNGGPQLTVLAEFKVKSLRSLPPIGGASR